MRNFLADYNEIAVSAHAKQTDMNTAQTLDTKLIMPKTSLVTFDKTIETNKDKATGYEEVTERYDKGGRSSISLPFDQCRPGDLMFLLAYHYGAETPSAWGTGYKHVAVPEKDLLLCPDFPAFSLGQRIGNSIFKALYPDLFVDTLKVKWEKDKWLSAEGGCKGSGMETSNITKETVAGFLDATTITLAENGVQGTNDAERLNSIHQVLVENPAGTWTPVTVTAASDAVPAVLTITAPGGAHTACNYKVLYVPTEAAWATFPAAPSEPPLLCANMILNVGGKWDGSAIAGGDTLDKQFDSVEHSSQNGMILEARPASGFSGLYANYAARGERSQTLSIDKDMRDYIMQQKFRDLDEFVIYLKATGPEFETGKNYYVEAVFPRVGITKVPIKVNGKVVGENIELIVMEDTTYGSVQYTVANKVAAYAA